MLGPVGLDAHDLGLPHGVLGLVQGGVEPLRERVEVLGVERGEERGAQRQPQEALELVGAVLGVSDGVGGVGVAVAPPHERVHALDGDLGLLHEHAEHVGRVGQERAGELHGHHLSTVAGHPARGTVTTTASRAGRAAHRAPRWRGWW